MGEQSVIRSGANALMVLITIGACTGYLFLLYQGHNEKERYQSRIHTLERSLQDLEQQLSNNSYALKRAQDSLLNTEESRVTLETQLSDLQQQNWQGKFTILQNDFLHLQQKQNTSEAEVARLDRVVSFLHQQNDALQTELNTAHSAKTSLENERISAEENWKKKQQALDAELQQQQLALEDLTARLEKAKPLQNQPETMEAESTDAADTKTVAVQHETAGEADDKQNPEIYRMVRLQSASSAMQGKPSATRRHILMSVIPTVPGGISGDELLTLISGMEGTDVLVLIQNTDQYLMRPVDDKTINALVAGMNKQDADTARQLFAAP